MERQSVRILLLGILLGQAVSCGGTAEGFWLERKGLWKCDKGLALIKRYTPLMRRPTLWESDRSEMRAELKRGKDLIVEGLGLLGQAQQKRPTQPPLDLAPYIEALKAARFILFDE